MLKFSFAIVMLFVIVPNVFAGDKILEKEDLSTLTTMQTELEEVVNRYIDDGIFNSMGNDAIRVVNYVYDGVTEFIDTESAKIIKFDESGIQIEVEPTIALDSTEVIVKITPERPTKVKVKLTAKFMGGSGLCIIIFMLLIL